MPITKNLRDGIVTFWDASRAHHITCVLDEGDLTFSIAQDVKEIKDRGTLSHLRKGDEEAMDVSFSFKFIEFYGTISPSVETPFDALQGINSAIGWTSTRDEDVYCISIQFDLNDTSDAIDESLVFPDFYFTNIEFAEGDDNNTLAVTGRSFATAPTMETNN